MNTAQSFFLLALLLISALLALTVLLIIATEQPDSLLEGRRRVVLAASRSRSVAKVSAPAGAGSSAEDRDGTAPQDPTTFPPSIPSASSATNLPLPLAPLDAELEKLAEFGPSEGGKFMGLQLVGESLLYVAKDDGRVEVRDSRQLGLIRTVSTGIRIHRMRAVNERILVILDASFGRLVLFDAERGSILRERTLTEPAKELAVDSGVVGQIGGWRRRMDGPGTDLCPCPIRCAHWHL